jgi:hypothetical protein
MRSGMTALSAAPVIEKTGPKYKLEEVGKNGIVKCRVTCDVFVSVEKKEITNELFNKMNQYKGQSSIEDAAAQLREGAGDDEWN